MGTLPFRAVMNVPGRRVCERGERMKHKVTVEVETKKRFPGMPYRTTGKERITADGKTYRRMKREQRPGKAGCPTDEEIMACALIELEEEMADLFGGDC